MDFATLLADVQRLSGKSDREIADALGLSAQAVRNWKRGAEPSLANCEAFAAWAGIPLSEVIAVVRGETPDVPRVASLPDWFMDALSPLSIAELAVLAETARGLLRLRTEPAEGRAGESR